MVDMSTILFHKKRYKKQIKVGSLLHTAGKSVKKVSLKKTTLLV